MAYIVILNPLILGGTKDVVGHTLQGQQVAAVTALSAGLMTVLFGLIARLPFAFAAGLGINSFLAVSVVRVVTWPEAMGLVVIDGLVIVLLAATGLRRLIFNAVPAPLKTAITVGIGMFIAFIGLVDSGFVRSTNLSSPPVQLGEAGSVATIPTIVFLIALIVMGVLMARKVKGALLIGIVVATVVAIVLEAIFHVGPSLGKNPAGWNLTVPALPTSLVSVPNLGLVGQVDLFGAFGRIGALAAVMLVFTLVFTNFFDAMGSMTGLATERGSRPPRTAPSRDCSRPSWSKAWALSSAAGSRRRPTRSSSSPRPESARERRPASPAWSPACCSSSRCSSRRSPRWSRSRWRPPHW